MLKRTLLAIMITAVTSSFILAACNTIYLLANGQFGSRALPKVIMTYLGPVWLLGSCAAACWAGLLAMIVELPKLKLTRFAIMKKRMWPGVVVSILGVEWLLFSWITAGTLLMPSLNIKSEVLANLGAVIGSFAIGGVCSGVTWWKIVGDTQTASNRRRATNMHKR